MKKAAEILTALEKARIAQIHATIETRRLLGDNVQDWEGTFLLKVIRKLRGRGPQIK